MLSVNKSKTYIILILVIILIVFLVLYCRKKPSLPPQPPDPAPTVSISLPAYYAIDIPLVAQKGNSACWAATIQMLSKDSTHNVWATSPIYSRTLAEKLPEYYVESFEKINDPNWEIIKKHISEGKSMVAYKYFNESLAHVFVVKGYQESAGSKWILVNDPWPVKKGKITAIAFNQFLKPYNNKEKYESKKYTLSTADPEEYSEPVFSLFCQYSLKTATPSAAYAPPHVKSEKFKNIATSQFIKIAKGQIDLLQNFDNKLFINFNIDYKPKTEKLQLIEKSLLPISEFSDPVAFIKYKKNVYLETGYKFDGQNIAWLSLAKTNKPLINLTFEYQKTDKYLYVSRFENYAKSEHQEFDTIKKSFKMSLLNPSIAALLGKKTGSGAVMRKMPGTASTPDADFDADIEDIAILPLAGGMVYSFTYPPFEEKIVVDPHHQLKIKAGQKALFISAEGTPYYRLSAIDIPARGELLAENPIIKEEWKETVETYNISTGILPYGGSVTLTQRDPLWYVSQTPKRPAYAVDTYGTYWQPTPIGSTKARWIGVNTTNSTQTPGIYTFVREIKIEKEAQKLLYDFALAYDDDLLGLEIEGPDGRQTNLFGRVVRSTNPTVYYLSSPIKGEINDLKKGVYRLKIKVNFVDAAAALLVSGRVKTVW
jgi:Papain-like cysteine protease AvrRpt2